MPKLGKTTESKFATTTSTQPLSIDQFVQEKAASQQLQTSIQNGQPLSIEQFVKAKSLPVQTQPKDNRSFLRKTGEFLAPTLTKTIDKVRSGEDVGLRDIGGSALEIGSFAIPGGAVAKGIGLGGRALSTLSTANRIKLGAGIGASSGALASSGRAVGEGEDLGGIATSALEGGALGGAFGAAIPVIGAGASRVKNAVIKKPQQIVESRAKELANIENNYAQTRKANLFSKDAGAESRKRVASTDVLVDAVDENGLLRTKQPGGAVEQYKAQTIDGVEGVVRQNLERLGEVVPLSKVEKELTDAVKASGLEGADLATALRGIKREIAGYRLKADRSGNIPLVLAHDAKISTTKSINYLTPPEQAAYRKAIARGLKKTVEKNSKFNTEQVNKELAKFYEDIALLERLDGKRVKGGKLGKYFSQISGNIVGAATGGAVGGPAGSALGTIIGGELASRIKGSALQKTLGGRAGLTAPKNPILEEAKRLGGARSVPVKSQPSDYVNQSKLPVIQMGSKARSSNELPVIQLEPKPQALGRKAATQSSPKREAVSSGKSTPKDNILQRAKKFYDSLPNKQGGFIKLPSLAAASSEKAFKNFDDLSTKLLSRLEGKTTVSKQFISDLTNSGDLKQAEKDLFRELLKGEGDTINVKEFANKVKSELLPLKAKDVGKGSRMENGMAYGDSYRYENINLPDELRGPVANYTERVYESPIKTSAGDVHFSGSSGRGGTDSYFAHSRIEDLPDKQTRRVIEAQSDLFQKGRLEDEVGGVKDALTREAQQNPNSVSSFQMEDRASKLAKLEPYRNTWHERVIREEVKQAAKDGKTKLQFPTGETAMKIEGLGETARWFDATANSRTLPSINQRTLKVGQEITQQNSPVASNSDVWIITDVLGDGKFKAVPKGRYEYNPKEWMGTKAEHDEMVNAYSETFDISGKVDTENPIYKFYEKTVQKYLTNKYGGKVITDPQGVRWVEIDVKPEYKKLPIEAFGVGLLPLADKKEERRLPPLTRKE